MTAKEKIENAGFEDIVIFDNPSYDDALIGVSTDDQAVYDYERMVECLMVEDGMSYEEAAEFIDFNTIRSLPYVPGAPIIVYGIEEYAAPVEVRDEVDPRQITLSEVLDEQRD